MMAREASDNPNPPLATNSKAKPPTAMAIIAPATAIRGFERSRALRAPAVLSGGFELTARVESLSLLPVRPLLRATWLYPLNLPHFSREKLVDTANASYANSANFDPLLPLIAPNHRRFDDRLSVIGITTTIQLLDGGF